MQQEQRRLAAILAMDVAGYSRLMAADESGTLAHLKRLRAEVIDPKISRFHGHIVGSAGDSLLIEFASAVNAVQCAMEIQAGLTNQNAGLPDEMRMLFRMGINLGDVIVGDGTIHGDGVNVAARLEKLAKPGSVCIGRNIHEQVKGKLAYLYSDLGDRRFHNIPEPVRVFCVTSQVVPKGVLPAASAKMAPLPDKPSIAVLPFTNMSGDPEQQYFSDGITEDIIAELSRFRQLLVIARNSSFQYRDTAVDVRHIASELGVRFVVQGSVRKAGIRLRVTTQLIDATSGSQMWAEHFDRELTDIFRVQDEITRTIVASLAGRVEDVDRRRALRKSAGDLSAYDLLLRGSHCLKTGSQRDVLQAREMFQRVIELDPDYAAAYVALAETYFYEAISNWTTSPEAAAERLFELGHTASRLDDQDSRAHLCLAYGYWRIRRNFEMARAQIEEAIALNPNDLDNYCLKGFLSTYAGELEEGIWCTSEAIRRAPNMPEECLHSRVMAEFLLGRYGDAIGTFGRMANPPMVLLGWIAACYAELGRNSDAQAAMMKFRDRARAEHVGPPDDNVEAWRAYWLRVFPAQDQTSVERLFDGLRKAGLPL